MTGSRAGSLSQRGPCGIRRDMSRVPAHPRVPRRPAEAPRGPGLTRQGSLSLRCTEAWPRLDQLPGLAPAHRGPGGGSCSARWEPLLLRNTGSVTQRHRVRGHSAGWCLGQTCSPGVRAEAQEWLPVEQLPHPDFGGGWARPPRARRPAGPPGRRRGADGEQATAPRDADQRASPAPGKGPHPPWLSADGRGHETAASVPRAGRVPQSPRRRGGRGASDCDQAVRPSSLANGL